MNTCLPICDPVIISVSIITFEIYGRSVWFYCRGPQMGLNFAGVWLALLTLTSIHQKGIQESSKILKIQVNKVGIALL
jgi:hypothetical protein